MTFFPGAFEESEARDIKWYIAGIMSYKLVLGDFLFLPFLFLSLESPGEAIRRLKGETGEVKTSGITEGYFSMFNVVGSLLEPRRARAFFFHVRVSSLTDTFRDDERVRQWNYFEPIDGARVSWDDLDFTSWN
jgi:hypothetical protein